MPDPVPDDPIQEFISATDTIVQAGRAAGHEGLALDAYVAEQLNELVDASGIKPAQYGMLTGAGFGEVSCIRLARVLTAADEISNHPAIKPTDQALILSAFKFYGGEIITKTDKAMLRQGATIRGTEMPPRLTRRFNERLDTISTELY